MWSPTDFKLKCNQKTTVELGLVHLLFQAVVVQELFPMALVGRSKCFSRFFWEIVNKTEIHQNHLGAGAIEFWHTQKALKITCMNVNSGHLWITLWHLFLTCGDIRRRQVGAVWRQTETDVSFSISSILYSFLRTAGDRTYCAFRKPIHWYSPLGG